MPMGANPSRLTHYGRAGLAIFAEAFNKDPDFFAFYRSMQAYEAGLKAGDTRLLLKPDSNFFRYFNNPLGKLPPAGSDKPAPAAAGAPSASTSPAAPTGSATSAR